MANKNKKKSCKASRKTSRKPRRKASRKTSRKPRRKASRKTSKKPRRKASKKPRRKASRKPRRKASRKTSRRNKFRVKTFGKNWKPLGRNIRKIRKPLGRNSGKNWKPQPRRNEPPLPELRYGTCRIPKWIDQRTQMISPHHRHGAGRGTAFQPIKTCAQYIIHAHGCHTKMTNRQVHRSSMENINVITYAPMGQSLEETCARTWHNYLVRRRPQFIINPAFPNKKPPRYPRVSLNCRPWVEFSADYPPSEILVAGDDSEQFKSGVLDITECCNRPSQRASYKEFGSRGIQAPIVMKIKPREEYRLSDILKQIKAYNDVRYPGLKNIFVHLLTCMDDASNCSGGNCRREETDEEYDARMEAQQAALHHGW